ncbi:hypothetical protein N6B72_12350 [Chryseobacterium soli]|uniref:hypothetical protein n=1 Tax=Chryseobacterium soli TaxID=445961 RepID=UPI0029531D69|nr:hypothetical protein [Chryseobacterium soli]MDV7697712.1 hypothetical protein [Chryseobacterium soli]
MKRKIHLTRMLLVIVTLLSMSSCVRDDLAAESQSQKNSKNMSAKFASRSFWKEDNVYINKVQQVFLKVANLEHVRTRYGELNWDYAMTFGNFNETYALVPIIKDNKVVLLMEAVRTGNKVFFYEKDNKDLVEFFNLAMYSNVTKYDEVINKNGNISSKALPAFVCTTRWLSIGCSDNEPNCVPYVKSITNCEYQGGTGITPKTFDPIGMDGGGDGNNGYEYPDPPEEQDPCAKLKLQTTNNTFKSNITSLQGKTGESHESGYRIGTNPDGTLQNQLLQNKPGTSQVDMKIFSNTITLMHSHYNTLYPMFSPGDIILFNQWIVWAQSWNAVATNTPKIPLNNLTLTVVTSNGNYSFNFDGSSATAFPNYTQQQYDELNEYYAKMLNEARTVSNVSGDVNYNMEKLEKQFLNFMEVKMNMTGLVLFRNTDSGNTKLGLNSNGTLNESNCPE